MSHTAEIIAVGTEILLGNIANTDAQMLSQSLSTLGINVFWHTVVGDNPQRLRAAVELAALADSISAEIWEISLEIFLVISSAVAEEAAMPEEMVQDRVQTFVPVSVSHLMMPSVV